MPNTKIVQVDIEFSRVRWLGERTNEVHQLIRDELIKYSVELNRRQPTDVIAEVSPNLANELSFGDATNFNCSLLGVPVRFSVNWTLIRNFIRLTIS
jgi:hypothetical protein